MPMPTIKYLKSFLATCLLVVSPLGFASDTETSNEFSTIISDVRSNTFVSGRQDKQEPHDELPSLLWQHTFNSVAQQRDAKGLPFSLAMQIALTKVEEAYQDELDRLLDWQEEQLKQSQGNKLANDTIRIQFSKQVANLKQLRRTKLEQVNRLY